MFSCFQGVVIIFPFQTTPDKTLFQRFFTYPFRLDGWIGGILLLLIGFTLPTAFYGIEDAHQLASFLNDEAPLTMALDGMTAWPFGNPGNYLYASQHHLDLPAIWQWGDSFRYSWYVYYGGTYFWPAFIPLSIAKLLGLPTFPLAPFLLRVTSLLAFWLSGLVIYNFCKQFLNSRWLGLMAAMLFWLEPQISYYGLMIHPDSVQTFLALLFLFVTLTETPHPKMKGLCLGVLAGLIQGSKFGGPWLLPLALITLWPVTIRKGWKAFGIFTVSALMTFFMVTPYALPGLDPTQYYWKSFWALFGMHQHSNLTHVTWTNWLTDFLNSLPGNPTLRYSCLGLGILSLWKKPLLYRLAIGALCLLGLSQFSWYALNGHYWVVLPYLPITYLSFFILSLAGLRFALQALPNPFLQKILLYSLSITLLWSLLPQLLTPVVNRLLSTQNTVMQAASFLEPHLKEHHLNTQAHILYDDIAYFPPDRFPNAEMAGNLLTYPDFWQKQPDILILSSSLYAAPHYAQLIQTQHESRESFSPFSVRLYQDLFHTPAPLLPKQFGVQFLGELKPSSPNHNHLPESCLGIQHVLPSITPLCLHLTQNKAQTALTSGPTLRFYRILHDTLPKPIASSACILNKKRKRERLIDVFSPSNAFDNNPSAWMPARSSKTAWLGFDYGQIAKRVHTIRITWQKPEDTPEHFRVEYSDDLNRWQIGPRFTTEKYLQKEGVSWSAHYPFPKRLGSHRAWRITLQPAPTQSRLAVTELYFQAE